MPLHRLLKAMNGGRPAGYCGRMIVVTSEVNKMVIARARSQIVASYFVNPCGRVEACEYECLDNFEHDFGNVARKEISRP